jgi:hypothetical protein
MPLLLPIGTAAAAIAVLLLLLQLQCCCCCPNLLAHCAAAAAAAAAAATDTPGASALRLLIDTASCISQVERDCRPFIAFGFNAYDMPEIALGNSTNITSGNK